MDKGETLRSPSVRRAADIPFQSNHPFQFQAVITLGKTPYPTSVYPGDQRALTGRHYQRLDRKPMSHRGTIQVYRLLRTIVLTKPGVRIFKIEAVAR